MRRLLIALGLTGALAACSATAPPQDIQVHWQIHTATSSSPNSPPDNLHYVVEVTGIGASDLNRLSRERRLGDVLRVAVAPVTGVSDLPAMDGDFSIEQETLRFTPRFPLTPGVSYKAIVMPQSAGISCAKCAEKTATLEVPVRASERTTRVEHVYPSSNVIPENLLKFYVQFSGPMQRGSTYEHVKLQDSSGHVIDLPFLELAEELWDPDMTRLTLIIDPGRIKRGVKPLVDIGPVFESGKTYKLIIDHGMKDSAGNALSATFEKELKIGPSDRNPPDTQAWTISSPQGGTRAALDVAFNKPMDFAVARRALHVTREDGQAVAGSVTLGDEERSWHFVPEKVWEPRTYTLVVERTIEDLAGNNIGKPFDVDLFDGIDRKRVTGTVRIAITIR